MNFFKGCHLAAITIIATCCLITEATYAANPCEIGAEVTPKDIKVANGTKKVKGKCVIEATKIDYSESNGVTITCDDPNRFISNGKECILKFAKVECQPGDTRRVACDKLPKFATVGDQESKCVNGAWVDSGKCDITKCSEQHSVQDNKCVASECNSTSKPEEITTGCPVPQPGWTKSVKTRKVCTNGLWEAWSECSKSTALCADGQVWNTKEKKCQPSTCTPNAGVSNIACVDGKDKMPAGALTAEKSGTCNALGTEVVNFSACVPKQCKAGFRFNAKTLCIKDECTEDKIVRTPVNATINRSEVIVVGETVATTKCNEGQFADAAVSVTTCDKSPGYTINSKKNGCVADNCGTLKDDVDPIEIAVAGAKGKQHVGNLTTKYKCVAGKPVVDTVTADCSLVAGFLVKGKTCVADNCGTLKDDVDPIEITVKGVKGKQHVGTLTTKYKCVAGKPVVDSTTADCSLVAGFTAKGKTCVPVK